MIRLSFNNQHCFISVVAWIENLVKLRSKFFAIMSPFTDITVASRKGKPYTWIQTSETYMSVCVSFLYHRAVTISDALADLSFC